MLRKVINLFHEQDGDGDGNGQRESVTWKEVRVQVCYLI